MNAASMTTINGQARRDSLPCSAGDGRSDERVGDDVGLDIVPHHCLRVGRLDPRQIRRQLTKRLMVALQVAMTDGELHTA